MIINHKNIKYSLDIRKAIQLGVMTKIPKTRPVMIKDIPNNTIFRWSYKDGRNQIYYEYMMADSASTAFNNCISLDGKIGKRGTEALVVDDEEIVLEFLDAKKEKWIREIEID